MNFVMKGTYFNDEPQHPVRSSFCQFLQNLEPQHQPLNHLLSGRVLPGRLGLHINFQHRSRPKL